MAVFIDLAGKIAVVTGAAQGIGEAIVQALAASGATVVIADLNAEKAATTAERLGVAHHQLDVTDSASVAECFDSVVGEFGTIDVLVNNAGIDINAPAEEMTDEQFTSVVDVNLKGVFFCSREAAKTMLAKGEGVIVNIASMSGIISNHPQPQCAYNASKAAVIMLTKSLAGEWASRGIRVNAVSPGYVNTHILQEVAKIQPEWTDLWNSETPLGRPGEVHEVANLVRFLASDQATYMHGSNVVIDGGFTSW